MLSVVVCYQCFRIHPESHLRCCVHDDSYSMAMFSQAVQGISVAEEGALLVRAQAQVLCDGVQHIAVAS